MSHGFAVSHLRDDVHHRVILTQDRRRFRVVIGRLDSLKQDLRRFALLLRLIAHVQVCVEAHSHIVLLLTRLDGLVELGRVVEATVERLAVSSVLGRVLFAISLLGLPVAGLFALEELSKPLNLAKHVTNSF